MRPQPIIFKILKKFIKIHNAYQAHKTPTDYPRDPFERLRHNVAKNALPDVKVFFFLFCLTFTEMIT